MKKTAFETILFPFISYKYLNRLDGDQDMFQPFLIDGAYSGFHWLLWFGKQTKNICTY